MNKDSKALSLRTQKLIARYGRDAQYPVCQAALELWQLETELATLANDGVELERILTSDRQLKEQARALLNLFYKEGKQKEAIQADAQWHKINDHLKRTEKCYQATTKLFELYREGNAVVLTRFKSAFDATAGDTKARRALRRLRKSWIADQNRNLKSGELRVLGLLNKLSNKVIQAAWVKGRAIDGYVEAAFGGDRLLSDEEWQGRLTAQEARLYITETHGASAAGDKDAKEIRRAANSLGIQLAKDQPGRKWKKPRPEKEERLKKPRGRPRKAPDFVSVGDTEEVQAFQARGGKTPVRGSETEAKELKAPWELDWSQADFEQRQEIEREINKLKRRQKGLPLSRSLLQSSSKWKPQGQVKRRTTLFATWIDSLAAI